MGLTEIRARTIDSRRSSSRLQRCLHTFQTLHFWEVIANFAWVVSSIHYLLVVLTCGIYGRQADGTYFGAKAYTELRDAGPESDHMYSA